MIWKTSFGQWSFFAWHVASNFNVYFVVKNYFTLNKATENIENVTYAPSRATTSREQSSSYSFGDNSYNYDYIWWLYLCDSHYGYYPVSFDHRQYYYGDGGGGGISIYSGGDVSGGGGTIDGGRDGGDVIGEDGGAFGGKDIIEIDGGDGGEANGGFEGGAGTDTFVDGGGEDGGDGGGDGE